MSLGFVSSIRGTICLSFSAVLIQIGGSGLHPILQTVSYGKLSLISILWLRKNTITHTRQELTNRAGSENDEGWMVDGQDTLFCWVPGSLAKA